MLPSPKPVRTFCRRQNVLARQTFSGRKLASSCPMYFFKKKAESDCGRRLATTALSISTSGGHSPSHVCQRPCRSNRATVRKAPAWRACKRPAWASSALLIGRRRAAARRRMAPWPCCVRTGLGHSALPQPNHSRHLRCRRLNARATYQRTHTFSAAHRVSQSLAALRAHRLCWIRWK